MGRVISFPWQPRAPEPDLIRIGYDFDRWCITKFYGPHARFCGREEFPSETAARIEAGRRVAKYGVKLWPDLEPTPTYYGEVDGDDCA